MKTSKPPCDKSCFQTKTRTYWTFWDRIRLTFFYYFLLFPIQISTFAY